MEKLREGGVLLAKIHQLAGRVFNRKLKKHGIGDINSAQGRILFALWENDGIPISELSGKTLLEKSTLTSMLDRLEAEGYLVRIPSKEDRRKIIIKRIEKDRTFQQTFVRVSQEMTELFYNGFSAAEIDRFEKYMKRILDNLVAYDRVI